MKRKRILLSLSVAFALLLLVVLAWVGVRRLTHGTLLVSARVSNTGGEQMPASSTRLYLLDADMIELAQVKQQEMSPAEERVFRENPKLHSLAGLMNARRREAYQLGPDVVPFMEQSMPLWQPHVLQTGETDQEGRVTFRDLKPGNYWLMGRAEMPYGGVAFWNLLIEVKSGETSVALGPANSLQCSGCR
jgi:hypothetical protein